MALLEIPTTMASRIEHPFTLTDRLDEFVMITTPGIETPAGV
jgi:hypothetical protein